MDTTTKVWRYNPKKIASGERPMYKSNSGKWVEHAAYRDSLERIALLEEKLLLLHQENERLSDALETRILIAIDSFTQGDTDGWRIE